MNTRLVWIHALSPLHCGTGQSVSGIDLPIAREKATGIPLVPGSSLKGVLRARPAEGDPEGHLAVFGPDTENAAEHAGGVQFADAHLVFLPVRSIAGTFAWVTSPFMLRRLQRDAREAKISSLTGFKPPSPPTAEAAITSSDALAVKGAKSPGKVVFEDLDFIHVKNPELHSWALKVAEFLFSDSQDEQKHFADRVCVLHDDVMALLLETGTDVITRNRLEPDTKTVADGALWSEEALPGESILAGLLVATPVSTRKGRPPPDGKDLLDYVSNLTNKAAIQIGGKASVGRGLCRVKVVS